MKGSTSLAKPNFRGKILVIKPQRLRHTPPALYATEELLKAGHKLVVLEYQNPEERPPARNEIPTIDFRPLWLRMAPTRLQSLLYAIVVPSYLAFHFLRAGKPKAMIAHNIVGQWVALVLSRLFQIPYIVHSHEVYKTSEERGVHKILLQTNWYRKTLQRASLVLFPDVNTRRLYRRYHKLTGPTLVVANCPPLRSLSAKKDIRTQYNLRRDSILLLYLGGIGPYTYLAETIEAIAGIPSLEFLIAGWADPHLIDSLKKVAEKQGVLPRVHFLGPIAKENKWDLLEGADISLCVYSLGLLRTRYGSTGSNKLMESMASGLPVVAGTNRYLCQFVQKMRVGSPVFGKTNDELRFAIKELVENNSLRRELGRNGRTAHETEYHFEKQIRPFLEAVNRLVDPTGAQSPPNFTAETPAPLRRVAK